MRHAFQVFLLLVPAAAAAQPADDRLDADADAATAAEHGAFLPWGEVAVPGAADALVTLLGGWDGPTSSVVLESAVDLRLVGRVSVRGGATYLEGSAEVLPVAAVRVDTLDERRHGIDLALSGGYEARGFNLTPAVVARASGARAVGGARLVGGLAFGIGTEEGERYGEARLGGTRRLARRVHLGFDTRARIDLERDAVEPPGEPDWELVAGPVVAYTLGRVAITTGAGISARQLRLVGTRETGVQATIGIGTVL